MCYFFWRYLTYTNIVDPDETLQNAAFHMDLYCLQKYLCRDYPKIQKVKGVFRSINADIKN